MNRWVILAILFVARAGLGVQFQTVGSVSDHLAAEFAITFTEVGTLIGFFFLPGLVLSLPSGYIGRFASDRTLVCVGLACLAIGGALTAYGDSYALAVIGRLISGSGFVISSVFFAKMVTDWFVGKEIATAMGVLVMSWPFGIAIGQIGHGWIAETFQWQTAFYAASMFCVASLLLVLLFYQPPAVAAANGPRQTGRLSRREFGLITLAAVAWSSVSATYIVYLSFVPQLLGQNGFSTIEAAAIASLASWAMIISGPLVGQVADRSGRPDTILYICLAIAVGTLLALPYGVFTAPLCLAFGLIGMAPSGIVMALPGEALNMENRAYGMGVFFTWFFVLTTPAPIFAGWLFDQSGDARLPIYFAAALLTTTAVTNLAFRFAQRGRPAAAVVSQPAET